MMLLAWLAGGCVVVEATEVCATSEVLDLGGLDPRGVEGTVTFEQTLHDGPLALPDALEIALTLTEGQLVAEEGDFDFAERVELTIADATDGVDVLCYDRAVQGPAAERLELVAEPVLLDGVFASEEVRVDLRLTVRPSAVPLVFSYASEVCLAGRVEVRAPIK